MQVGANSGQNMRLDLPHGSLNLLRINDLSVSSSKLAQQAIKKVDSAIKLMSAENGRMGSYENELDHIDNNVGLLHWHLYNEQGD